MKRFIFLISMLLPFLAAGQVTQIDNYNEALDDTASMFYRHGVIGFKPSKYTFKKTDSGYNFGMSLITTPRDTFVCYSEIGMHPSKGYKGRIGHVQLQAEDLHHIDSLYGVVRVPYNAWKYLKKFKHRLRCKAKAYQTYASADVPKSKWYVKCLTADITYYPLDKAKSTVKYSVKYKKYRPLAKYGVHTPASREREIEHNKKENAKKTEWIEKQHQKDLANRDNPKYQKRVFKRLTKAYGKDWYKEEL